MTRLIIMVLMIGATSPLLAQEDIIKDFAETKREKKYCLYPSTLRMANLERNKDYDDLVNHVEKLLIYRLDSATRTTRSYMTIINAYQKRGYDDYASMSGGKISFDLVGKTGPDHDEFVGVYGDKQLAVAFYLRGKIAWQKIYPLFDQLQNMKMIDLMNFRN